MNFLPVGKLAGVFGIRGELKCDALGANASALAAGRDYALDPGGTRRIRCTALRPHGKRFLLTFDGIATPEAARALAGTTLYAEPETLPLLEGEYFDRDLIGMRLVDENGRDLGVVAGVEHMPAHDCLVVGAGRALVPMVAAFIRRIDLDTKTISVGDLPIGLIEGEAE